MGDQVYGRHSVGAEAVNAGLPPGSLYLIYLKEECCYRIEPSA
jgi:hypothetical protein